MDFDPKQRDGKDFETNANNSAKLPKLLLQPHLHASPDSNPSALTLFVPEPTSSSLPPTKFNSLFCELDLFAGMGSYFSLAQWQELELQALIFRHMIAGAAVPQELLHLVKKSLIASPSSYYLSHSLQHHYPHYQPALVQSGYWGRAAMDPEPGRCRRTDGKKWRCSRDVVAGQKYCERHVHRGRNRSRKPVEVPTSAAAIPYGGRAGSNGVGGEVLKSNNRVITSQGMVSSGGGGGTPRFTLSGPSPSLDLLHLNHRPTETIIEPKCLFETQNDGQQGSPMLRHFFDGWPRSLDETTNSATTLSISMPGNPSSDFSLKVGSSSGDELGNHVTSLDRGRLQLSWGVTWEAKPVAPMGGPLAEALRSATSNSSPTSVLDPLPPRGQAPKASYVST
ncbi:growth-regulating factor 3 [Dorcoceras hygrometricum]|uniref:Growth-regulating factor n=1 Tax=Dorcoceras hygrometricum TaxID=472368 RepID=A0A2Z7CPY3_9LAMI|nr:growth-regulating factor 3 [Dorcoceras hygrometricum]